MRIGGPAQRQQQIDFLIRQPAVQRRELAGLVDPAHRLERVALRARDPRGGQRTPQVRGIQLARPLAGFVRFLEVAEVDELLAAEHLRNEIQWIEAGGGGVAGQRLVGLAAPVVEIAEKAQARGIVRIAGDGSLSLHERFVQLYCSVYSQPWAASASGRFGLMARA